VSNQRVIACATDQGIRKLSAGKGLVWVWFGFFPVVWFVVIVRHVFPVVWFVVTARHVFPVVWFVVTVRHVFPVVWFVVIVRLGFRGYLVVWFVVTARQGFRVRISHVDGFVVTVRQGFRVRLGFPPPLERACKPVCGGSEGAGGVGDERGDGRLDNVDGFVQKGFDIAVELW
jgi:hypothetical protein